MVSPLVELTHVSKKFDPSEPAALCDVTAQIFSGDVTGLVGPDGAGKTTLMRLIAGLLLPSHGTISTCGFDPDRQLSSVHHVVSYMPQRFGLYEDLTVAENLTLYTELRNVEGEERRQTTERLLEFTGLGPFTGRLAGKLSGGMKQKLGLACALIGKPKLLLLDEPGVGVDPISRRELWRLVYDLIEQGIGVVWSTAYLDEAERCGMVIALNQGRMLYDGPPGELTKRVSGRTFLVKGALHKRRVLTLACQQPEVIDGVIQGESVRIVLSGEATPPRPESLGEAQLTIESTTPRFEDAFVDLLGGGLRGPSPLSSNGDQVHDGADVVVEASHLTKRFGDFVAADQISFRIKRGEIFGLLGPNGAGKSTTFKMLCGLLVPTEGKASVVGFDLYRSGGAARAKLGYMAQKFSLYGNLSTEQNLNFFAGVYGLRGRQKSERIQRMVSAFGLKRFMQGNSGDLPLGYKQRLALVCAILHDPPILFLDEPTSGVDPLTRREFWSHINAMVERGVTVLVTTHFLDEAEYCDRIALVYKGKVIATGSPDDLKEQAKSSQMPEPTLEDAFIELVESFDSHEENHGR